MCFAASASETACATGGAIMRTGNGSGHAKCLPDATEDFVALTHRLRDLQNSLKVCFAIIGSSRERVQARAGSKRVPLTSG